MGHVELMEKIRNGERNLFKKLEAKVHLEDISTYGNKT